MMPNIYTPLRNAALAVLASAFLPVTAHAEADAPPPPAAGWQTWTANGDCGAILHVAGPAHVGVQNGDSFIAVMHKPREHNFNGVTIVSGLSDDITGVHATIEVAGVEFEMLVSGNAGFVRSGKPEKDLIDLFARNKDATVTWFLKDGLAVQNYDVSGFEPAKRTIDLACPHPNDADAAVAPKAEAPAPAAKPARRREPRHGHRHRH
jgi:hypothetical protein